MTHTAFLFWNLSSGSWKNRFSPQLYTLKGQLAAWDCCDVIPVGNFFRLRQCTVLGLLVTFISIRTSVVRSWPGGFSNAHEQQQFHVCPSLVLRQYAGNMALPLSAVARPSWKIPVDKKRRYTILRKEKRVQKDDRNNPAGPASQHHSWI